MSFADVEADFTMHLGRTGEAYFVDSEDVVGMYLPLTASSSC